MVTLKCEPNIKQGNWAGEGIRKNKKKPAKKFIKKIAGVDADKRKDAKLPKVIISEKRVKKVRMLSPDEYYIHILRD